MDDLTARTIRELAREVAELRRRIQSLETSPRAMATGVRGGFTTWYANDDWVPSVYVGADADADDVGLWVNTTASRDSYFGSADQEGTLLYLDGAPASFILRADGSSNYMIHATSGKMYAPLLGSAWEKEQATPADGNGRALVSGSSFATTHRALLPVAGDRARGHFWLEFGSGVTGVEWRFLARLAYTNDALLLAGGNSSSASGFAGGSWPIPDVTGSGSSLGRLIEVVFQVRVAAGSGSVGVAPWAPLCNWPS